MHTTHFNPLENPFFEQILSLFRLRESSRDELFEKAKGEILDEVVNLSQVSAKDWEHLLYEKLWEKLSQYCFENIYLSASNSTSSGKVCLRIKNLPSFF